MESHWQNCTAESEPERGIVQRWGDVRRREADREWRERYFNAWESARQREAQRARMEIKQEKQDEENMTRKCVWESVWQHLQQESNGARERGATILGKKKIGHGSRRKGRVVEIETSKRRRGYKTAFITQHVLWTDGGELCIKAFTLLLYFCTRVENEPACGTKCLAKFSHLNPGGYF